MKAFVAAIKVADGYFQQANLEFGSSKYVGLVLYPAKSCIADFHLHRCFTPVIIPFRLQFLSSKLYKDATRLLYYPTR